MDTEIYYYWIVIQFRSDLGIHGEFEIWHGPRERGLTKSLCVNTVIMIWREKVDTDIYYYWIVIQFRLELGIYGEFDIWHGPMERELSVYWNILLLDVYQIWIRFDYIIYG